MRTLILLQIMLISFVGFNQTTSNVIDAATGIPIYGVKISSSLDEKVTTDPDGAFSLQRTSGLEYIIVTHIDYYSDTISLIEAEIPAIIELKPLAQEFQAVIVTVNRRKQRVEEVPISMEVLSVELIDEKAITNVEDAVNQAPGVFAMDGQVSVRGGSGFAYGVGSRVLVLHNGMPLISPDLGDSKWNTIPLESASQIEVIKGASSVLYGSGALNGLVSISQREPTLDGDVKVKFQSGIYDNPKRASLKWWSRNPMSYMLDGYYGKAYKKWGYTVSINGYDTDGYKLGETESRARLGGSVFFKPNERVKVGVAFFGQYEYSGRFVIWESDSLPYTPFGHTDPDVKSSLTYEKSLRICVDPYLKMFDKKKNKHQVNGRYYLVSIGGANSVFEASKAEMNYLDYQFSKNWGTTHYLIAGAMTSYNRVISKTLFGDHNSINSALYGQYELKQKKWDLTFGIRAEYFQQDNRAPDSKFDVWETKTDIPIYPIIRLATHWAITKSTHARGSFGQGIRFPAVGERYLNASTGGVNIFPNPELQAEKGWSAEVGIKQEVKVGNWKGSIDVAGFLNHYENMIEFTFGIYSPDTIQLTTNPDLPGYINNWVGFRASNTEEAQIAGVELSVNGEGSIKDVQLKVLLGYTYMEPKSLNNDPDYQLTFSDSGSTMLKYRFNHMAKLDVQAMYKGFILGVSGRYNSYMHNIDALFENDIAGVEIMPGLKDYRLANQQGSVVLDGRIGYRFKEKYKVGVVINNFLNTEYSSRPGDIQPPRQFILQLQYGI